MAKPVRADLGLWNIEIRNKKERDDFVRYELMDNLYRAQNMLRSAWVDSLPKCVLGIRQIEAVPWALKEGHAEEFKVNGRTRLMITSKGRKYMEGFYNFLGDCVAKVGV